MRHAAVMVGCTALILCSCGEKRTIPAAAPVPVAGVAELGIASWYGHPYHGRASASGEIYDMEQLTAAHRTLPFGTLVRVVNLDNDKSVEVRINDRGPFVDQRIIDLSHAAAQVIGMIGPGVARVRVEVLQQPVALESAQGSFAVQVGAFHVRANAERLREQMAARYGASHLLSRPGDTALWRVLVGRAATIDDANTLAARIRSEDGKFGAAFVVRDDAVQSAASIQSF